jgi:glycosyltransferase involved in cell wall biosynthesis
MGKGYSAATAPARQAHLGQESAQAPMKVCFFSTGYNFQGGAERCQAIIARHLLESGHEAHVVLPAESELSAHYRAIGAHVHIIYWQHLRKLSDPLHVMKYLFWLAPTILRVAWLCRRRRIDLVHVNEILDFQGLIAAKLAGVPGVVFVRTILDCPLMNGILATIATSLSDAVACVSGAVYRMTFRAWRRRHIRVLHDGGPDYGVFDPGKVAPIRPDVPSGTLVIGMVSKLVANKGHLQLLDLAHQLDELGYNHIHYVVVGGPVAGHENFARLLDERIEQYELRGRVHLVGQQSDVAAWLAGMDIVCHLPLVQDSLPGVPMEAAAMGKPILGFISGGLPEELTHPTSARLVPIGDIDALARNAKELIENPQLRAEMGLLAHQEIRRKFSLPSHLRQVDDLYEHLLR